MPERVADMRLNLEDESVVVIPSVTVDRVGERSGTLDAGLRGALSLPAAPPSPASAARRLRDLDAGVAPDRRVLPGPVAGGHPRATLGPGSTSSPSTTPHPARSVPKLLERPRLLAEIRALIPDRSRSHLVPYNTTPLERDVALALGIPMYGADPRFCPPRHQDRLPATVRRRGRASSDRFRGPAHRRRRRRRLRPSCGPPVPRSPMPW